MLNTVYIQNFQHMSVYIHSRAIRVIWASVVCNLD